MLETRKTTGGDKPPLITVVASPGAGKTTLGAAFPSPVFILAEDGTASLPAGVDYLAPLPLSGRGTREMVLAHIDALTVEKHGFETLVLDSITSLHELFVKEIIDRDNVETLAAAAGGYNKGAGVVAGWHSDVLARLNYLRRRRGLSVVLLSHQAIEKVDGLPDSAAAYSSFTLSLPANVSRLYVAESDVVAYIRQGALVTGEERTKNGQLKRAGRMIQTRDRTIITSGDGVAGYSAAKCRYSSTCPPEIAWEDPSVNPFVGAIPFFGGVK